MRLLGEIKVKSEWDGLMIKEVLYDQLAFSRKGLATIKNEGDIRLNDISLYVTRRVQAGDTLAIYVPAEHSEEVPPEAIPVDIVYEDADIAIINKPAGIVVHPTRNYPSGTIANGLQHYWLNKGERYRFRPVNRLDLDTSGLVIVAKNQYSHHVLALQLASGELKRNYQAVVHGSLPKSEGLIDAPLIRDPNHSVRRLVDFADRAGLPAQTRYRVLRESAGFSIVELELLTGRTHQLRAHLAWLGAPLVGDDLYGGVKVAGVDWGGGGDGGACEPGEAGLHAADAGEAGWLTGGAAAGVVSAQERQALHAWEIAFAHPTGAARSAEARLSFQAPYPPDLARFIRWQFPAP